MIALVDLIFLIIFITMFYLVLKKHISVKKVQQFDDEPTQAVYRNTPGFLQRDVREIEEIMAEIRSHRHFDKNNAKLLDIEASIENIVSSYSERQKNQAVIYEALKETKDYLKTMLEQLDRASEQDIMLNIKVLKKHQD